MAKQGKQSLKYLKILIQNFGVTILVNLKVSLSLTRLFPCELQPAGQL